MGIPNIMGVNYSWGLTIISIKQAYPGHAMRAAHGALGGTAGYHGRFVIIVDDDIDVFDPVDVEWAVATRVQADRDVLIVPNARAKPLDPSLPLPVEGKIPTTAKMGIDATIPENIPRERYQRIVYFNQGKVELKNYLGTAEGFKRGVAAAKVAMSVDELIEKVIPTLEKSHCFFADLLEKFPRADYKTVASAVGRLYDEGKIKQDKDGRFEPKTPQNQHGL